MIAYLQMLNLLVAVALSALVITMTGDLRELEHRVDALMVTTCR